MLRNTIYKFLTAKCKERGLAIESLPEILGCSRSSLYRYMKGIVHMSPEIQTKFTKILQLDKTELAEFDKLLALSTVDQATIATRDALDNFVFEKCIAHSCSKDISFIYYENDKFFRTLKDIYEIILSLTNCPDIQCTIRIVGCINSKISEALVRFLERMFKNIPNISAEHLVRFPENNNLHSINALFCIMPLLRYPNYSVYCSGESLVYDAKNWFSDSVVVDVCAGGMLQKCHFITFLEEQMSSCLATADKNVFSFINMNYESTKMLYDKAFLEYASIDTFGNKMAELEESTNYYLLKPNCCYHRIPIQVYQSMIARISPAQLQAAQEGLNNSGGSLETGLAFLGRRMAASYHHCQVDVHSMAGLENFAKTGRLSDHFDFFPAFNKQERRDILVYMRDRNEDTQDKYRLFITRESFFQNGYILVALEDVGVLIEYSKNEYVKGVCANLFIQNKTFSDIITDYIAKHIPAEHALSREQCSEFLNHLIQRLESDI